MYKNFIRISLLILWNLFAFLVFAVILGALFWNKGQFLIWSVVASIVPLTIILFREIKRVNKEFDTISKQTQNDTNGK